MPKSVFNSNLIPAKPCFPSATPSTQSCRVGPFLTFGIPSPYSTQIAAISGTGREYSSWANAGTGGANSAWLCTRVSARAAVGCTGLQINARAAAISKIGVGADATAG